MNLRAKLYLHKIGQCFILDHILKIDRIGYCLKETHTVCLQIYDKYVNCKRPYPKICVCIIHIFPSNQIADTTEKLNCFL